MRYLAIGALLLFLVRCAGPWWEHVSSTIVERACVASVKAASTRVYVSHCEAYCRRNAGVLAGQGEWQAIWRLAGYDFVHDEEGSVCKVVSSHN